MLLIVLPLIYITKDIDIYLISIFFISAVISIASVLILKLKFNFNYAFVSLKESFSVVKKSYKFALLSVVAFGLFQTDKPVLRSPNSKHPIQCDYRGFPTD